MSSSYVIKLKAEESIGIYGFMNAKKTLAWKDILCHKHIQLKTCIENGIGTSKLYKLQPDLHEWIKFEKVNITDFPYLKDWAANPFDHFHCTIGDLIMNRKYIDGKALKKSGIRFQDLVDKYGLSYEFMAMLKYSSDDWIQLGITQEYIDKIPDDHWNVIFGDLSRKDAKLFIQRESKCTEK